MAVPAENPAFHAPSAPGYGGTIGNGKPPPGGGGGGGAGTAIASGLGGLAAGTLIGNWMGGHDRANNSQDSARYDGGGGYDIVGDSGGGYDIAGDSGGGDDGGYDIAGDS